MEGYEYGTFQQKNVELLSRTKGIMTNIHNEKFMYVATHPFQRLFQEIGNH